MSKLRQQTSELLPIALACLGICFGIFTLSYYLDEDALIGALSLIFGGFLVFGIAVAPTRR